MTDRMTPRPVVARRGALIAAAEPLPPRRRSRAEGRAPAGTSGRVARAHVPLLRLAEQLAARQLRTAARSTSGRRVVFDTFGRSSQIEVVDGSRVNPADVVAGLSATIRTAVPAPFQHCLGTGTGSGATASPTRSTASPAWRGMPPASAADR